MRRAGREMQTRHWAAAGPSWSVWPQAAARRARAGAERDSEEGPGGAGGRHTPNVARDSSRACKQSAAADRPSPPCRTAASGGPARRTHTCAARAALVAETRLGGQSSAQRTRRRTQWRAALSQAGT